MTELFEVGPVAFALAGLLVVVALLGPRLSARLALSGAKHRSLAGHARMSRALAKLVPRYAYDDAQFFRADDAGEAIAARRRAGFERLSRVLSAGAARTLDRTAEATAHISDLQFTESYRVPFQFSQRVRAELPAG